jgi:hypothetical protein
MPSESTAIQARTVFRQDTAPQDTDALWIDTSQSGDPLKKYDPDAAAWESVSATDHSQLSGVTNPPHTDRAWTLDGNSPDSFTNVTSATYTLSGTYDIVRIVYRVDDASGSGNDLGLYFNGDTGSNYDYYDLTGTKASSDSRLALTRTGGDTGFKSYVELSGRWNKQVAVQNGPALPFSPPVAFDTGRYLGASPLDSFTVEDADSNGFDATFEVYGADI